MHRMSQELRELLEPGVKALGFELVAAELAGGRAHKTLRVYIDSPRGISIADCARASEHLSAILDVEDPVPGGYTLEVSSPGLDRPLVTPADFTRFMGRIIKVRMQQPLAGRRNFTGRLVGMVDDRVVLEVEAQVGTDRVELDLANMDRARLVPEILGIAQDRH